MAEYGHEAQVISVKGDRTFELNLPELEKLLLRDEIKDLPVVVVSIVGAARSGKSFHLNFFLKYLKASQSAREDGSWLEEDNEPLQGFTWRGGLDATTKGMFMWSEPFITTLPNGDKVAVLLIDTQGIYENKYTALECTTIFTVSALLSSIQIYFVSKNIREKDLHHFQVYTGFGNKITNPEKKPFQNLQFVVKDWPYAEEYPYGKEGGDMVLNNLKMFSDFSNENQGAWNDINSCYEKVSCFLMPHPGFETIRNSFQGSTADIEEDYKAQIKDLVKFLFAPENLVVKKIFGQQIKAQELFSYMKTYIKLLLEQVKV